MHIKKILLFIIHYIAYGLAIAFIFLLLSPKHIMPKLSFFENNSYSFHDAVVSSSSAVVNVYASNANQEINIPLFQDPLFQHFFKDIDKRYVKSSVGSGVIMNSMGYIITNAHVVNDANNIYVTLNDGQQTKANLIGVDVDTDLAVIHIELQNIPKISIGDSSKLNVGDIVLAIGNPYNLGQTVTQGIISATSRRRQGIFHFDNFIQTDASINLGNSGGALIKANGEIIGINTAIISSDGNSKGIGLAIPINKALDIMNQIIEYGKVVRGWLGIEVQSLGSKFQRPTNMKQNGVLITAVMVNSPAEKAGIMPGDILTQINHVDIISLDNAVSFISKLKPNNKIKIQIFRGWEKKDLTTTIVKRPSILSPKKFKK